VCGGYIPNSTTGIQGHQRKQNVNLVANIISLRKKKKQKKLKDKMPVFLYIDLKKTISFICFFGGVWMAVTVTIFFFKFGF